MIRRSRSRALLLAALMLLPARGVAQPEASGATRPASQPAEVQTATRELPEAALAALSDIRDDALDFSQPGFYAVVEAVRQGATPGSAEPVLKPGDWRALAERPAEFRGRPVSVRGSVGRNSNWSLPGRPEAGTLWQLELYDRGQPLACTVILTEDASDIPLDSVIEVTGYFVMLRSYLLKDGSLRRAALLVGAGPSLLERGGAGKPSFLSRPEALWWGLGAVAGGLMIALLLLRRAGRTKPTTDFAALRPRNDVDEPF